DEKLELRAGDLLLLDGQNLADTVGGIDDEFVGLEPLALGRLLGGHSGQNSFTGGRFAATGQFGFGRPTAACATRGLRWPPNFGGLFWLPPHDGRTFVRFLTRFYCHCSTRGTHALYEDLGEAAAKIRLSSRESVSVSGVFHLHRI